MDLGLIDYADCWDLQKTYFNNLVACKLNSKNKLTADCSSEIVNKNISDSTEAVVAGGGLLSSDNNKAEQVVLLCEHPAVYTLGKSGDVGNLLAGEEFLKSKGASFYRIDRGGDITFHGPGQLVGYPILDLEELGLSLREYIHAIEEAVIGTIAEFGISGTRVEGAAGVWLRDDKPMRKICAIGVRSSRYVTMHGFALNANTDLRWFDYINPCGFADRGATSISKEIGEEVDITLLKKLFITQFEKIINIKIKINDYANRQTLGNQASG